MKIEFLYFDGCPNHEQALANLNTALDELGLKERVEVINVLGNDEAIATRFLGSPSIRINGKDLEHADEADTNYSMRCRRYKSASGVQGYPDSELITAALRSTQESGSGHV